jgi:hypothetical protein
MERTYRFILALLVLTFSMPVALRAEDTIDPQGILAIAKITGACGIMDEMVSFQKKTKMEGGDDFVFRFWQTESARQGKTVQQMHDDCNKAISAYDFLWKSTEPHKQ